MTTTTKTSTAATFAALLLATAGMAGAEQELTAKGIYYDVDRYQKSGLKFHVILDDRGKSRRVPATYRFRRRASASGSRNRHRLPDADLQWRYRCRSCGRIWRDPA